MKSIQSYQWDAVSLFLNAGVFTLHGTGNQSVCIRDSSFCTILWYLNLMCLKMSEDCLLFFFSIFYIIEIKFICNVSFFKKDITYVMLSTLRKCFNSWMVFLKRSYHKLL